jgi:hypothetical protein
MPSDIHDTDAMLKVKKAIVQIAFKKQKSCDYYSWAILKRNKIMNGDAPSREAKLYEMLSNKNHKDRIILNNGPLLCFKEHDQNTVAIVCNLIFADQSQWRKIVYDHFARMQPGHEIGDNTLSKLRDIEVKLLSDDWIQAALEFYDIINIDWLCNLMGLEQANAINDEEGMQKFATDVFRPSIASASSIGVGVLQPSNKKDEYAQDFTQICEEASDLCNLLDKYYYKYGHIPLCYDYSLYSILDSFFAKHSYNKQQKWEGLWNWADSKDSPLARYHVCCYFVRNSNNVPESKFQALYDESLNIIHMPVKGGVELQWTLAWKLRCKLAKSLGQKFEVQLHGANTENVYSQAWWMAEKIASLYGNRSEDIATVLEYTISDEEYFSEMIWQVSRPRTQSSSLRYATLMTSSLWAVSLISQIDDKLLDYVCNTNPPNAELFVDNLRDSLFGCFPLKAVDKSNFVYAYDATCINVAEYLLQKTPDAKNKEFPLLVSIRQLSDTGNLINLISKIPESNHEDQLIAVVAMRVKAFTNPIEDESEIWENVCNEDWLVKMFSVVDEKVYYSINVSLIEIMLQKQDKWAWQLPHLFSMVCQKHISNEKIKYNAFACVVISSICSDTCSALKRTLLKNKTDISGLQKEWSKRLKAIYSNAPDYTKSRLRPVILCLDL